MKIILKSKIRAAFMAARKEYRSIFWNPLKRKKKYSIEYMTKQLKMSLFKFRNTSIKRLYLHLCLLTGLVANYYHVPKKNNV